MPDHALGSKHRHIFEAIFRDAQGREVWRDRIENFVPDEGLNYMLECIYGAKAPVASYYGGLVTGPGSSRTYAAADTLTGTHAGWAENTTYSNAARPTWTPNSGAISGKSVSNSNSPMVFNINGSATIAGLLLATDATKGGTATGKIVGIGNFSSGDKAVTSGGTLTVTTTATAATA